MVYSSLLRSTPLKVQISKLPRTFCRYKSLTAAIERGKAGGPDRPSRFRTRATADHDGETKLSNRRTRRFERFGPPRDDNDEPPFTRKEPSRSNRDETQRSPRSSRFGRVGSSRSQSDAPFRFDSERFDNDRKPGQDFERGGRDSQAYRTADRGSRRSRFDDDGAPRGERRSDVPHRSERTDRSFKDRDQKPSYTPRDRCGGDREVKESRFSREDTRGARREQNERPYPHDSSRHHKSSQTGHTGGAEQRTKTIRDVESLPYTTAASEFVYGHSSVLAALKANRRKLYTLYVHSRGANRDGLLARIRQQKMFSITKEVGDEYLRAMDKASSGRPHNGVILESSPLPVPPITELKTVSIEDGCFSIALDSQSAEDVTVNGKQEIYQYKAAGWRHPLILYVDGVVSLVPINAMYDSSNTYSLTRATLEQSPAQHISLV